MSLSCKRCGSPNYKKFGFAGGKQRYKCHACERTFRVGDARIKYGIEDKLSVLKQYLEGVSIRSIERITGIPSPLIVRWIRHASQMLKQELSKSPIPEDVKAIEILEVDELFTFYQKKAKRPMYGLLWTGTGIKLLISQ